MEPWFAIVGVVVGAGTVLVVLALRRRSAEEAARALVEQSQVRAAQDLMVVVDQLKTAFSALSREALSANSDEFLKLAGERLGSQTKQGESALESRKKLIDQTVEQISKRLTELGGSVQALEKDRRESQGRIQSQLEQTTKATLFLRETTGKLAEALADSRRRGQWGERMAEDVLQRAGMIEGINYSKQTATESGTRPDFTFLLPNGHRVNMDVKFPLANYLKCVEATDVEVAGRLRASFLRDVRGRIKEVTSREYIDPTNGTVDYVLAFIPNEQVYGFIHESDPNLLDEAMRCKVVLCSPLTLYAVVAVIRQATENYRLEETSREILGLLGSFTKEWGRFTEVLDRMGKRLEDAMGQYEALSTTRTRQLERKLDKIEALRSEKGVALPEEVES